MLDPFMYAAALKIDGAVDLMGLPEHLANCLRQVRAKNVTVKSNRVTFTAGLFRFVTRGNVLSTFGYGELIVDAARREVEYRVSFRQIIVVSTILAVFFIWRVFAQHSRSGQQDAWLFLSLLAVALALNLGIGLFRFQSFVRRSLETTE